VFHGACPAGASTEGVRIFDDDEAVYASGERDIAGGS
jgi:hypothetical protein